MSDLQKKLHFYKQQAENLPQFLSHMIREVVNRNVSDYLDTLNGVSPEEEMRMINRNPQQSDSNVNKNFRDRVNSFKVLNRELKQQIGQLVLDEKTVGIPLKAALVDDSILQLYKMANEIAQVLKSGKIDGPSLDVIVEKAIDNAVRKTTNHEVKDMMSELVQQVELKYKVIVLKDLETEKEKYYTKLSEKVNSLKFEGKQ